METHRLVDGHLKVRKVVLPVLGRRGQNTGVLDIESCSSTVEYLAATNRARM